jgi:hypothetical protein
VHRRLQVKEACRCHAWNPGMRQILSAAADSRRLDNDTSVLDVEKLRKGYHTIVSDHKGSRDGRQR